MCLPRRARSPRGVDRFERAVKVRLGDGSYPKGRCPVTRTRPEEPLQARPQSLVDAHAALDAAVAAAYGCPADISEGDVLRELLALNGVRSTMTDATSEA